MCNEQVDYSIIDKIVIPFVIAGTLWYLFINNIDACMYTQGNIICVDNVFIHAIPV